MTMIATNVSLSLWTYLVTASAATLSLAACNRAKDQQESQQVSICRFGRQKKTSAPWLVLQL